jgi:hypothetical protein
MESIAQSPRMMSEPFNLGIIMVSILLPRNSVPFHGQLFRVSGFRPIEVPNSVNTLLIPCSIRQISGNVFSFRSGLRSLAFELWSEFEWIGPSAFRGCPLRYIFVPRSVDSVGLLAFAGCQSISSLDFQFHSFIWQIKSENFSAIDNLRAITIPTSIRQIHRIAFSW